MPDVIGYWPYVRVAVIVFHPNSSDYASGMPLCLTFSYHAEGDLEASLPPRVNRRTHAAPPINRVKWTAIGQFDTNALHLNPLLRIIDNDDF